MNPAPLANRVWCLAILALFAVPGAARSQDVRVNDRIGDPVGSMQFSPSIAAIGDTVLVAWGQRNTGSQLTLRCAMSYDGGATFTQLGAPPLPAGWTWFLDAKVVADPDGAFYFAGRTIGSIPTTGVPGGIFVARGVPTNDGILLWDPAVNVDLLHASSNQFAREGELLDLAFRASDHRALLVYNTFASAGDDTLRFRTATSPGTVWGGVSLFTAPNIAATNARIVVEFDGTVVVGWLEGDYSTPNPSFRLRATRTENLVNFNAIETVASTFDACSNAPVRSLLTRPGMALAADPVGYEFYPSEVMLWSAGFDAATAPLPALGPFVRRGSFDVGDTTTTPDFFNPGEALEGALATSADIDFWRFFATAGTRYVFAADSGASVTPPLAFLSLEMVVVGPDGRSWLGSMEGLAQENVSRTTLGFTAPVDGAYYLRVFSSGVNAGGYRIRSAVDTRPVTLGRDQGDLFLTDYSSETLTWSAGNIPVSAPNVAAGFHESCPAMTYADDQHLWIGWYDWTQSPGSAISRYHVSRYDIGLVHTDDAIASGASCDWMNVRSARYFFALGRTSAMRSSRDRMYMAWTDGRDGDPDIYLRSVRTDVTLEACPGTVTGAPGDVVHLPATVHNHNDLFGNPMTVTNIAFRNWAPYYTGFSTFNVPAGSDFVSDLAVQIPDTAAAGTFLVGRSFSNNQSCPCYITVLPTTGVRSGPATFALDEISPNPSTGPARMAWSLPRAGRVTLEILDASGRRVREIVSGDFPAGRHERSWDGADASGRRVAAGLYWVRLRGEAGTLTRRFVRLR